MKTTEITGRNGNTAEVGIVHFTTGPEVVLTLDTGGTETATLFLPAHEAEALGWALLAAAGETRRPPVVIDS